MANPRPSGGRRTPPQQVYKRSTPIAGATASDIGFPGDEHYAYGRLPPLSGYKHAFMAVGNGKGDIVDTSVFEFWVEEVGFGYGSSGQEAQSKLYNAYYSKTFNLTPISIQGRVPTEKYLAEMQDWIRAAQVNIASGNPRIRLVIDAANIAVWGYVNSFLGGQKAGFDPAPQIQFDFTITKERNSISQNGEVSQQIIAYFLDPQDKYWARESQIFVDSVEDGLTQDAVRAIAESVKQVKAVSDISDWFGDWKKATG